MGLLVPGDGLSTDNKRQAMKNGKVSGHWEWRQVLLSLRVHPKALVLTRLELQSPLLFTPCMDILPVNAFFPPCMFFLLFNKQPSPFLLPALQFFLITVLHFLGCRERGKGQNLFQYRKERPDIAIFFLMVPWKLMVVSFRNNFPA